MLNNNSDMLQPLQAAQAINLYPFADKYPVNTPEDSNVAIVHEDFKVHNLEQYGELRNRFRATFKTPFLQHFIDYVNNHGDEVNSNGDGTPTVFIKMDMDTNRLGGVAVFNMGVPGQAGHGDDRAYLNLEYAPEFKALTSLKSSQLTREDLIEFLEDWLIHWSAFDMQDDQIAFAEVLRGLRNLKAKSTKESNTNDSALRVEKSESEIAELNANIGILPEYFSLNTPMFVGLEDQDLKVRFKTVWVDVGNDRKEPRFKLAVAGLQSAQLKAAEHFQDKLASDIESAEVYIGEIDLDID